MTESKTYQVIHQQKTDTQANWESANVNGAEYVPEKGELIIYQENGATNSKMKIGNGVSSIKDLGFFGGEGGSVDVGEIEEDITEIKNTIGDFEQALDRIIEIQNSFIGGEQ